MARTRTLIAALLITAALAVNAQPPALERYIVVLQPAAGAPADVAADVARTHGGRVGFVYTNALRGFSIMVPPQAAVAIASDPRVSYVEADNPVSIFAQTIPTGLDRIYNPGTNDPTINPLKINGVDDYRVDVDVAVIDTGIDFDHPDLNVVGGTNCTYLSGGGPPWSRSATCKDGEGDDDHYHGTHVAGTIGAIDNGIGVVGVAPGARLWAVKVLDSSGGGYDSTVVAGIDWVTSKADIIEVANMSLGGSGRSQAQQDAINAAVNKGVVIVVAAGNSNADASNFTPAGLDNVVTVSALADFDGLSGRLAAPTCRTDDDDTLANFSNWGSAIDIAAPGVCIRSTFPVERGSYGTISGTSMASPHVAGAAALLASQSRPKSNSDVGTLVATLIAAGNYDWVDDSGDGIKEPLLDITAFSAKFVAGENQSGGDGGSNLPPVASFTYSCNDLSCAFDARDSTDGDGEITSYAWDFDDGNTGSGATVSHTFGAAGTYSVKLTVTDDDNATDVDIQNVPVGSQAENGLTLSAVGYKVRGIQHADLSWQGAASASIDVFRDGAKITTVTDTGSYTDNLNARGGGTVAYHVCETGGSTCSSTVIVSF